MDKEDKVYIFNMYIIKDTLYMGFPGGANGKESVCQCRRHKELWIHIIPGSGRSPGGGYGNPLQDSCLENSMDRGTWGATVHEATES